MAIDRDVTPALRSFASDVGPAGPVRVVGGGTGAHVGGRGDAGAREVRAPAGIASFEPSELIVRVGAGTTVGELAVALAGHGQCVALPAAVGSTVGGVLAVGRQGVDALGSGPVRNTLLEATYVDAWGRLVRAGAPVVKNVAGFDLCRLLVGSLGTVGLIGEVVLRTTPLPRAEQWLTGVADVGAVRAAVSRPAAVLWDGSQVWVLLRGHPDDVVAGAGALAAIGCGEVATGPPPLPPHRWSLDPSRVDRLGDGRAGAFVAEVGVGVVHASVPAPHREIPERLAVLHRSVKARFDPGGRLNPGRSPLSDDASPVGVGAGC